MDQLIEVFSIHVFCDQLFLSTSCASLAKLHLFFNKTTHEQQNKAQFYERTTQSEGKWRTSAKNVIKRERERAIKEHILQLCTAMLCFA